MTPPAIKYGAAESSPRVLPTWPSFDPSVIAAVSAVLASGKVNYWTGTEGRQFESEFAAYLGTQHAIALANGTVALELALRCLGIGPGDEVIVPSRTFVASGVCVNMVGAQPVFADVDPQTQTLTASTVAEKLSPRTRAVIAVHFAGCPCDMDTLMTVARRHNLKVIEDCAQAHGARYKDHKVGTLGDVAAFSFCQDKILTTGGEGGMLVTNDGALADFARSFKDHGRSLDRNSGFAHVGTNWRMTEMQSAIGRQVLPSLDEWVTIRQRNAGILRSALHQSHTLQIPEIAPNFHHAYYKFYVCVRPEQLKSGWTRDRVVHELVSRGVPRSAGGAGMIHQEPVFASGSAVPQLPITEELARTTLVLPVHPTLQPDDMEWIAAATSALLRSVAR